MKNTNTNVLSSNGSSSSNKVNHREEKRRWRNVTTNWCDSAYKQWESAKETLVESGHTHKHKINNRLHLKYKCVFISYFYYILLYYIMLTINNGVMAWHQQQRLLLTVSDQNIWMKWISLYDVYVLLYCNRICMCVCTVHRVFLRIICKSNGFSWVYGKSQQYAINVCSCKKTSKHYVSLIMVFWYFNWKDKKQCQPFSVMEKVKNVQMRALFGQPQIHSFTKF